MRIGAARRPELWLAVVVLAYLGVAATYNYNTPLFETPDEIFHYLYVRHLAEGQGLPRDPGRGSREPAQEEAAQPPLYYAVAAALTFWAPRGDLNAISERNVAGSLGDPRTDGNKNIYLHGPAESFPWRGEVLTVHLVRFTTTLWGAATVVLTYLAGRILLRSGWLAVTAAAIVAFTPEFLFMSSAVSNDVAVSGTGALLLYVAARVGLSKPSTNGAIALGVAGAAVILAKPIAAGALALIVIAVARSARRFDEPLGESVQRLAVASVGVLAFAGWWFGYNLLTYGSLMPLQSFLSRSDLFAQMPTVSRIISDLNGLYLSYWAFFGWFSIPVPSPYYQYYDVLMILGLAGLVVQLIRSSRNRYDDGKTDWASVSLPLALVATVLLGIFAYRLVVQDFHGRLLLGASSGIALLLTFGWSRLGPQPLNRALTVLGTGGLALTAVILPWTVLGPAYQPPALATVASVHPSLPSTARFGDEIRLIGADLSSDSRVLPGGDVTVTLYLQALRQPAADYLLFLKVVDPSGNVLTDVNSHPGHGTYQTSLWTPGPVLVDHYVIHLPATAAAPSVDRIVAGFYRADTQENLPTFDDKGDAIGSSTVIGTIVVQGASDPSRAGKGVAFREGNRDVIGLIDHTVSATSLHPASILEGTLLFDALARPSQDYTIFVHLERVGHLLAQDDAPPLRGAFPTSYWIPGDLIDHHWRIAIPSDAAPGDYALTVGWYDPKTGARLLTPSGDGVNLEVISIE